mgnify:FL=1
MVFLDFGCCRYVCENIPSQVAQAVTEDHIRGYLYICRDELVSELVSMPFPSAMSQLEGVFDFLKDGVASKRDVTRKILLPEDGP